MAELRVIPPSDEIKATVGAIPGVRFTPGVVVGQAGPEAQLGPESAGAILVLHTSAVDDAAAELFWRATTSVKQQLPDAPGFIRLCSFFDGLSGYLVAFWRTVEDAQRFAGNPQHREAMAGLRRERFEYSHFVGLWEARSVHARHIYCEECGHATPAPSDTCAGCGNTIHDVFMQEATARHEHIEPAPSGVSTLP
jgi:hypothetical protein